MIFMIYWFEVAPVIFDSPHQLISDSIFDSESEGFVIDVFSPLLHMFFLSSIGFLFSASTSTLILTKLELLVAQFSYPIVPSKPLYQMSDFSSKNSNY